VSPTTALLIGVCVTALTVICWLGGILYLRRMRAALQATPSPSAALAETESDADRIEVWLARAAALPEGEEPAALDGPRDQSRLHELAARHFPSLAEPHPHLHLIGLTGVEKRLVTWVSDRTGMPNPFDALERMTGDPDELRHATEAWQDAHTDITAVIDRLCVATATLHDDWVHPDAERFFEILADYLSELDALAADVKATADTLRGLQAEAALAEGTIVGLINLLVGSLGGYVVEAVLTAGTMTPAVAAQAQVELTWVLKQVARVLGRLQAIYANTRRVLQSVTGFKGLGHMPAHFQIDEVEEIARTIDSTAISG
jgi:hypothetical protein